MEKLVNTLNAVADAWASSMWVACWQGGLDLIFVGLIVRIFPSTPPSIRCWLWRLALLKLLVSFTWTKPIELPLLPAADNFSVHASLPAQKSRREVVSKAFNWEAPQLSAIKSLQSGESFSGQAFVSRPSLTSVLFLLWVLGLWWGFFSLFRSWQMVKRIRASCQRISNQDLLSCCAELCRQFGLRYVPDLVSSDNVSSPSVIGVFKPAIVLPSNLLREFSIQQLKLMLAHELAHLVRKDLLWNWLFVIGRTLFFFHPLIWLAQKEWQLAHEMACDELVILKTNALPASYGDVLVKVAEKCRQAMQEGLVAASMAESFKALKRRVMAMQFIKPIPRKKLFVWVVSLSALALFGIVPWRLVAQPPKQTMVKSSQASRPTTQIPLRKGMELTYEGEALVMVSGKETKGTVKVHEFVKEVAPEGKATVVSLRVFRHPVYGPDASLRFVSVQPDGKESLPDEKQLAAEVPPKLFSLHFINALPSYFIPTQRLKSGSSWLTKERLPVYLYVAIGGNFTPWVEVEMKNQILRQEQVGGVRCWVVRRSLTKPVPIHGGNWANQLSERNETLWVDARTGLIHKLEAETILQGQKGKFRHNALKLELRRKQILTGSALERRLKELRQIELMQRMLSRLIVDVQLYELWRTLDKDKIDEAQAIVKVLLRNIRHFNSLFPNSPYIAYCAVWGRSLAYEDEKLERIEEFAERVGEPAPDFELTSVDGEKFQLSKLRGKVVVLNFDSIGFPEGAKIEPKAWKRMFSHVEHFHRNYKGKDVIVLGILGIDPPERAKEFVKALGLTFPILVDDGKVRAAYKIYSIPTDIVIGKDGRIRFIMGGYADKSPLREAIERALKE
jgi:beta-lactamase regulating signal transducer with metallopeptidase domain/peroxiredoxin